MEMFRHIRQTLACATIFAVLSSCVKEAELNVDDTDDEGSYIEAPLFLDVADMELSAGTKVTPENEPDAKVEIKNVWVVQFGGTGDDAVMARTPYYISNYEIGTSAVRLNTSLGVESTVFFIANTFNPLLNLGTTGKTTLAELKEKYIPVSGEESLFGVSGGKYYQRLNGITTLTVDNNTTSLGTADARLHLSRSISRLDIYVKAASGITVNSVQLCNVPPVDYVYTNRSLPDVFPKQILSTFDYSAVDYSSGLSSGSEGYPYGSDQGKFFRFYIPANKRGGGSATTPQSKGFEAPIGATYLKIRGEKDGNAVVYYFYLGSDFGGESGGSSADFNLLPNYKYTYLLQLSSTGSEGDSRAEYYEDVDFTGDAYQRANCYILNVPEDESKTLTFAIPVEKSDLFWNSVYGYKVETSSGVHDLAVRQMGQSKFNAQAMILGDTGSWTAELIWSDFDASSGEIQISTDNSSYGYVANSTESNKGKDGKIFIKVKGGVRGNAVVGIRNSLDWEDTGKGTSGTIQNWLWTWHLWITDYNPYKVPNPGSGDSHYFFSVPGGRVFRLTTTSSLMMDRPLGAIYDPVKPSYDKTNSTAAFQDRTLGLYYQYGRKDPFPNNRNIYMRGQSTPISGMVDIVSQSIADEVLGTDSRFSKVVRSRLTSSMSAYLITEGTVLNVPFSINHPLTFIYSSNGYWNKGTINGKDGATQDYPDRFNPYELDESIIWMDPIAKDRTSAGDKLGIKKSVFDPCPAGWKVPDANNDIFGAIVSWGDKDSHISLASYTTPMGTTYNFGNYIWPEPKPTVISESDYDRASFFALEGYYNGLNSSLEAFFLQCHYWTSTLFDQSRSYSVNMGLGTLSRGEHFQSQGYNIRCVKE